MPKARLYYLRGEGDNQYWCCENFDSPRKALKHARKLMKDDEFKEIYFLCGELPPQDRLAIPTIDAVIIKKKKERES